VAMHPCPDILQSTAANCHRRAEPIFACFAVPNSQLLFIHNLQLYAKLVSCLPKLLQTVLNAYFSVIHPETKEEGEGREKGKVWEIETFVVG